jgi:DNA mismatch repair protein MutS
MNEGQPLSVLWPAHSARPSRAPLSDMAFADLELGPLVSELARDVAVTPGRQATRERFAHDVLSQLLTEPEIIQHRQAVLADLLGRPALCEALEPLVPGLEALADAPRGERYRPTVEPGLERIARRLADLELLVETVGRLSQALDAANPESAGLRSVAEGLRDLRSGAEFESLERELPRLRETLSSVRSVTLGVNLGPDLTPQSATILELGTEPIEGRRALVWRLLGGEAPDRGLTPLQRGEAGPLGRPNELVRDLRQLLGNVVGPVATALDRFARVSNDRLGQLGAELGLLLGAVRLLERLRKAGLPICRPTCMDVAERGAELMDAYDPGLALVHLERGPGMVTNAIRFGPDAARVWVLTGPNRGGKTTYTRAAGVAQVLFQAGLFVPAHSACLSPVDAIYTHFPTREDARPGLGRLDLEAERLASIFQQATPRSLILLNEALSGTSALEALDLARGLVRGLRLLGARAIYVTHLHELATEVDQINADTPGDGRVGSLLAELDEDVATGPDARDGAARRTFKIAARPPRGASFAAEIAEQHGISYAQLARLLRERHLA